jgi:zinc transport system substrate-binding protein
MLRMFNAMSGTPSRGLIPAAMAIASATVLAAQARAETQVMVTIKPVHALVARVMEGAGSPGLLVSGASSPHTFSMKPSHARALNAAKVFFRTSEQIEPFTRKVISSLPASVRVVTLADAKGVELLDKRTGDTFEAHAHGEGDAGHDEHDGKADDDDHEAHHHPIRDGHVWLDPRNAKAMVDAISAALSEAEPASAATFEANAVGLKAEIDALETEIASALAPVKSTPFVVFHDAYQYFERRFGLNAVGSITVSPEVQPSAKRLSEIRDKIAKLGAVCVFAEPQFSEKLVNAVTEGTTAKSGTLDPEGATIAEGPKAYLKLMRGLAAGLKNCLGAAS